MECEVVDTCHQLKSEVVMLRWYMVSRDGRVTKKKISLRREARTRDDDVFTF